MSLFVFSSSITDPIKYLTIPTKSLPVIIEGVFLSLQKMIFSYIHHRWFSLDRFFIHRYLHLKRLSVRFQSFVCRYRVHRKHFPIRLRLCRVLMAIPILFDHHHRQKNIKYSRQLIKFRKKNRSMLVQKFCTLMKMMNVVFHWNPTHPIQEDHQEPYLPRRIIHKHYLYRPHRLVPRIFLRIPRKFMRVVYK